MEILWFGIFAFAFLVFLISGIIVPVYRRHKKATAGIVNFDSSMRKFVYRVSLSREEIISLLETKNETDELSCTFDFERAVIKFSEYGSDKDYFFQIQECGDYSILRLEQVAFIGMQSLVPFKLNAFMVGKLHAEIVPYSQYGF